jgi:hypothetical protein
LLERTDHEAGNSSANRNKRPAIQHTLFLPVIIGNSFQTAIAGS